MSRTLYSIRIFANAGLTAAAGLVGPIVPDGLIYVLRDIDVFELTSAGSTVMFVTNPLGGELVVWQGGTTNASKVFPWRGRQVYDEEERVGFQVLSGTWAIMASGYQLTKP